MYKIIVARDLNMGIGNLNKIPWSFKQEMKYFQKITSSVVNDNKKNCVIMGRKTYESIPEQFRPLKNRINIVLSRKLKSLDNVLVYNNIDNILNYVRKNKKIIESCFIIGGENIYKEFLKRELVTEIYETIINDIYKCDVFFPKIKNNYELIKSKSKILVDSKINKECKVIFNKYRIKNIEENNYLTLMSKILEEGIERVDRTGVGTLSLFGESLKYDIRDGKLPLLTTKLVPFKFIVEELLWFISGNTDSTILQKKKIPIWNGNTTRDFLDNRGLNHLPVGDIGAGYGFQLRHFNGDYKTCKDNYEGDGFDQLKYVIDLLKNNPTSRRILFSYWNPQQLNKAALPPCHLIYQFYVNPKTKEISSCLYQRSSDYFLANNYNAVSAIILTHMLGHICGYKPKEFTHFMADTHIYLNHLEQCKEQITRLPSIQPKIKINKDIKNIEDFKYKDFKLINYYPQKAIKGKMN